MPGAGRARVKELNQHLVCVLCGGYFIDATTIIECLHSFCRTCIVRYLETSKYCPICDVQVHKTSPLSSVRPDRILQNLVYKLVPGLLSSEIKKRKTFFADHKGEDGNRLVDIEDGSELFFAEDEKISLCLEYSMNGKPVPNRKRSPKNSEKKNLLKKDALKGNETSADLHTDARQKEAPQAGVTSQKSSDENSKSLAKTESTKKPQTRGNNHPEKRYLLSPAAMTISHLKKFVRMKFDLPSNFEVDIFNNHEILHENYSLMDIAYIFSWRRSAPLKLFYTIYEINPRKKLKIEHVVIKKPIKVKHNDKPREKHEGIKLKIKLPIDTKATLVPKEPPVSKEHIPKDKVKSNETEETAKKSPIIPDSKPAPVTSKTEDKPSSCVKSDSAGSTAPVSRKRPEPCSKETNGPSAKKFHPAPLHPAFPLLNAHAQAQREAGRKASQLQNKPLPMPSTSPIRRQAPQPVQLPKGLSQKHGIHSQFTLQQKNSLNLTVSSEKDAQARAKDKTPAATSSTILQVPLATPSVHIKPKSPTSLQKPPVSMTSPAASMATNSSISASTATPAVQHRSLPQIVQPRQSGHAVQPRFAQNQQTAAAASGAHKSAAQTKQKSSKSSSTKHNPQTVRARLNAQHQQQQQAAAAAAAAKSLHHNMPAQVPMASPAIQSKQQHSIRPLTLPVAQQQQDAIQAKQATAAAANQQQGSQKQPLNSAQQHQQQQQQHPHNTQLQQQQHNNNSKQKHMVIQQSAQLKTSYGQQPTPPAQVQNATLKQPSNSVEQQQQKQQKAKHALPVTNHTNQPTQPKSARQSPQLNAVNIQSQQQNQPQARQSPLAHPAQNPHVLHMQVAQRPAMLPVQQSPLQSSPPTLQLQPVNVSTPPPGLQMTPPTLQPQTPPIILGHPSAIPLLHPPVLQPLNLVTRGSPIHTSSLPIHSQPHLIHALPSPIQAMQQPPLLMSQQALMTSPSHIMTSQSPMLLPPPSPVQTHIHLASQQFQQHLQTHASNQQQQQAMLHGAATLHHQQQQQNQHQHQQQMQAQCLTKEKSAPVSAPSPLSKSQHNHKPSAQSATNNNHKPSNGKMSPPKHASQAPVASAPAGSNSPREHSKQPPQSRHSPSESGESKSGKRSPHESNNLPNGRNKERTNDGDNRSYQTHKDQLDNNKQNRVKMLHSDSSDSVPHLFSKPLDNNNTPPQSPLVKSNATTQTTAKPVPAKSPTSKASAPSPVNNNTTADLKSKEETATDLTTVKTQHNQQTIMQNKVTTRVGSVPEKTSSPPTASQPQSSSETQPATQQNQSEPSTQAKVEPEEESVLLRVPQSRPPPQEEPLELKVNSKVPSYVTVS